MNIIYKKMIFIYKLYNTKYIMNDTTNAGEISEGGWLNSWKAQGFDDNKCISEFIANSIDAKAKNISIHKDKESFYYCDDGIGMNKETLKNMFNVYRTANISNRLGNFGFGTKPAQLNLSRERKTIIITKSKDDKIYTAIANWEEILKQNKYIGMIKTPIESTQDDIDVIISHAIAFSLPTACCCA